MCVREYFGNQVDALDLEFERSSAFSKLVCIKLRLNYLVGHPTFKTLPF